MMMSEKMRKVQRLEACLSGNIPDRTPVALWRHFPVDDQTPEGLAAATAEFQRQYDFDLVKVTPASSFCLKDWGSRDAWQGATEGTRAYTYRFIQNPEDWNRLMVLDPYQGHLGDQLTCLRLLVSDLKSGDDPVPVIQTIFNPLSQAKNLVGRDVLSVHLRCYPEAVHQGLKTILETTQRFLEAVLQTGIDGIFYAVQHANYAILTEDEYEEFGATYDRELLELVKGSWLNMLHLHGENIMFNRFVDYPVQIINWHDRDTPPALYDAQSTFPGVVCGGLERESIMVLGNPVQVTSQARDAILETGGKRFVLGTGCVLPITAPRANILAARRSVEMGST
jgi:uroporphyrinogen decarboxylase